MTKPTRRHVLGIYGERLAADYLISIGYEVIERNWRCSFGEIDLIARDKDRWVFFPTGRDDEVWFTTLARFLFIRSKEERARS